ncbi:MAG: hypothetical protein V7K25_04335 [Nostoc sp.]|uniref:hypothetical protein n=1 Tax=Nostoc sp. TaxID=1180 RepID=UPI002FFA28BC
MKYTLLVNNQKISQIPDRFADVFLFNPLDTWHETAANYTAMIPIASSLLWLEFENTP